MLLGAIIVAVVVVLGWDRFTFLPGNDRLHVSSHDGRRVGKPVIILPSATPGQPPDFESKGLPFVRLPAGLAAEGREILVCGPGCGLLQGKFDGYRITLPPPVRATIRVPGELKLPRADRGIMLRFELSGVRPEIASVCANAPVPASHWDKPEALLGYEQIWLDPATHSASVLLPCTGTWRVSWMLTDRPPEGKVSTFFVGYASGEATLTVAKDGETHALPIDPKDLSHD